MQEVAELAGALELHVVAGQACSDQEDRVPDVVGRVEALDEEGLVLDDGRDGVVAVAIAHEVVVHGVAATAGAVLLGAVHALVRFGWLASEVLASEVFVGFVHVVPPPGCGLVM